MNKLFLYLITPFGPKPDILGIFTHYEDAMHCCLNDLKDSVKVEKVCLNIEVARKVVLNAAILEGTKNIVYYKVDSDLMPDPDQVLKLAKEQHDEQKKLDQGPIQPTNKPRLV